MKYLIKKVANTYLKQAAWQEDLGEGTGLSVDQVGIGFNVVENDDIFNFLFSFKNNPPSPKECEKILKRNFQSKNVYDKWFAFDLWSIFKKCSFPAFNKVAKRTERYFRSAAKDVLEEHQDWLQGWSDPSRVIKVLKSYTRGKPNPTVSSREANSLISEYWNLSLTGGKRKGMTYFELDNKIDKGERGPWSIFLYNPENNHYIKYSGKLPGHNLKPRRRSKKEQKEFQAYRDLVYSNVLVRAGFLGQKPARKEERAFTPSEFENEVWNLVYKKNYVPS